MKKPTYAVQSNGCWRWTGTTTRAGNMTYGIHRSTYAHRWFYEETNGPIPDGLQIDHLCRNTLCVNPAHLEAVDSKTNTLRGQGPTAVNARKTACVHGHPFDAVNTRITKRGQRDCRACDLERWNGRKHLRKSRAALEAK